MHISPFSDQELDVENLSNSLAVTLLARVRVQWFPNARLRSGAGTMECSLVPVTVRTITGHGVKFVKS